MSTQDIILIPIILGLAMIPTYVGYTVLDEFNSAMTDYSVDNQAMVDGLGAMEVIDNMIIFTIVGMGLAMVILAASIRTHPAFSVISIILLVMFVAISAWLATVYYEIQQASQFATAANELDNFVKVNNNLPLIVAALGVMILVALYAKPWGREEAQSF